mmetsp:Transcript_87400/g.234405  ORF Transcript_87400/g.234405 Transcript_87400/m.234405 type:complete len:302 (-) Transcript_87400:61-966(-)
MYQHEQASIHLLLEPVQVQVVLVFAERHLQLVGYLVDAKHAEHRHESDHRSPPWLLQERSHHNGRQDRVRQQQETYQLSIRKRKLHVGDLLRVVQVHHPPGELLIDSGADRWRYLHHVLLVVLCDKNLDHVQQHLHQVEPLFLAEAQVVQSGHVQPVDVDDLEALLGLGLDLVQSAAVHETREPDQGAPELGNLIWLGLGLPGEGHQATDGVKPLAAHLVEKTGAFPEAAQRLLRPEGQQDNGDRRDRGPDLRLREIPYPGLVLDLCVARPRQHARQHGRRQGKSERHLVSYRTLQLEQED